MARFRYKGYKAKLLSWRSFIMVIKMYRSWQLRLSNKESDFKIDSLCISPLDVKIAKS